MQAYEQGGDVFLVQNRPSLEHNEPARVYAYVDDITIFVLRFDDVEVM